MPRQQYYQERTGAAGIQMPGKVSVPVMPVDTRGAELLNVVAGAGERIGSILARDYAREQQTRISESLLAARKEFAAWEEQYVQTRQGSNALTAGEDFATKMREIADRQLAEFAGNPNEVFQRELSGQMAALTLRAQEQGAAYASGQRSRWENSVLEGQRAQLLADAERDPGNGAWLDFQLMQYGRSLAARGLDATAPMMEMASDIQLRRGLAYVQRGDLGAASNLLQGWKAGSSHPGDISARYEAGEDGSLAIGYDKKGGTSYGRFQLSSKQGSMDGFLRFLESKGGEAASMAARLRAAGPADTGGKSGAMPEAWKREAQAPGFADIEREYIQREFYEPAMRSLPSGAANAVNASPQLQQMVWSTAVQHGAAGAGDILRKAWREGMTPEDFVRSTYAERATRFSGSEPDVRASVQRRLRREADDILGGLAGGGGINGMSLAAAAQLEGAIEKGLDAAARQEAEKLARSIAMNDPGASFSEMQAKAFESLAAIQDPLLRDRTRGLVEREVSFWKKRATAIMARDVERVVAEGREKGLSPSQFDRLLASSGLSEEAQKSASDVFNGKITENMRNITALAELKSLIDEAAFRGKPLTEDFIMSYAYDRRMTTEQMKQALTWNAVGGSLSELSRQEILSQWRTLNPERGESEFPAWLVTAVAMEQQKRPGKPYEGAELRKLIAHLLIEGSIKREWWWDRDLTRGQALVEGVLDQWQAEK